VRHERNQFRRVSANVVGIVRAPTIVDPHVAADGPAKFPEPLQERRIAGLCFRLVRSDGGKHADPPHALALLRARRERPRCRAAEQRDEIAAPHSITSSAMASSVCGTSRPSAFAALRLIANSNLVGCTTGRSAGRAPLSTLPT